MSHSLPYSIPYITAPAPQYMLPSHTTHHTHMASAVHMVSPAQIRAEHPQRKRPKYTRSKTGCLTCRAKKIKVKHDVCCTWPDPAPLKKKPVARKSTAAQDNASGLETASRASGSSASRDATPSTRDMDNNVRPAAVPDSGRRYSGSQGYSYLESPAPMSRRQTLRDIPQYTVSSAPLSSGTNLSSSYSYEFHHSPSSISSRSNSRPSTANSLPPTHFNGSTNHASIDTREYRWETLPAHRAEASYSYYPTV
ncbi:hypothetical protein A7U60_g5552 [Sanghuangporus baumii]|uniref:Uncharacterized protein n=1 Tax=Sanghuangporus baumii TaxID=108892 RepID=A0A9Q5HX92_SANBA|nr:hypothetical protein A7U60_g5552 [Sanghuangporus baumii]